MYPTFNKKHNIKEFNLSFYCPNYYEETIENDEIKVFKNKRNSITIEVYSFEKNFLSNIGIEEKLNDYKGVLSSINYESIVQNDSSEIVTISNLTCGKHVAQIKTLKQVNKEISIIIPKEEYDLIFSIHGTNDDMTKNNPQIEKILNSIKIK